MGLGGLNIWHSSIVLVIVVLIFGTKRLKSIGSDLGGAIKGFKKAMDDDEDKPSDGAQKRLESDETDAEFPERKKRQEPQRLALGCHDVRHRSWRARSRRHHRAAGSRPTAITEGSRRDRQVGRPSAAHGDAAAPPARARDRAQRAREAPTPPPTPPPPPPTPPQPPRRRPARYRRARVRTPTSLTSMPMPARRRRLRL